MSLKAFHVVFIAASVMMCLGLAALSVGHYRSTGDGSDLGWATVALGAAAALLVYGRYFLRKLRNISYL